MIKLGNDYGEVEINGAGHEDYHPNNGLGEFSTAIHTTTRATELPTPENIQQKQANVPRHQSLNCQDEKIWCNLADCSLSNVQRNSQKTCNLC